MIPEAILDQIQDRVDIVDVIGSRVTLRRAGRSFKANCPFHGEKTPSFHVNPDKQIFHCFGCSAGGNVFTFLMKFEKKDFREAVEMLAAQVGIEIPDDRQVDPKLKEKISLFAKAHQLAADYFHRALLERPDAAAARAYLEKRAVNRQTIADFKIGFAPDSWDALQTALRGALDEKTLERMGFVLPRKDGSGYYDRFRNRIMFPILDAKGVPVAFGGRVMDDSVPKYLNSPETEMYVKGRHLYGLYQGRTAIREKNAAVVVEGYLDVTACHAAGFKHAVASLGTALTREQARLIRRHTPNVILLYDADKAGENATLRGLEIFLEEDMDVRIVTLPEGHDPDSYIRDEGPEKFARALDGAKNLFEYKLALLKTQYDSKTTEGRIKIAGELVGLFAKVKNEIARSAWTQALAADLGISEEALNAEMQKARKPKAAAPAPAAPVLAPAPAAPAVPLKPLERLVIGLLLGSPELVRVAEESLAPEDLENAAARRVFGELVERGHSGRPLGASHVLNAFENDDEAARLVSDASAETEALVERDRAFADCVKRLRESRLKRRREELGRALGRSDVARDERKRNDILKELDELNRGLKTIHEKK